jgi:phosphate starvation-inducible PhoH-like protein
MATKKRENKKLPSYEQEEIIQYQEKQQEKDKFVKLQKLQFKDIKLTDKQKTVLKLIQTNKIAVISGAPGTSKTFIACYAALQLFKDGKYDKIIITKPTEVVGGTELGHLPGTLEDKLSVYIESFIDCFSDIIEGKELKELIDLKQIEYKPVQFVRGRTFKNKIVIIDEIQNFDLKSLMALITRFGTGSKFILCGDENQNDISFKYVAINLFKEILHGIEGVGMFEFEKSDIMRDPILIEITDRYEQMKLEGKLTPNKRNT